jgi:hypothetical protein
MKEVYVLYDNDGFIKGAGRIDRAYDNANRDGSTALERIEASGLNVVYTSNGELPDATCKKIVDGELVDAPEIVEALKIIEENAVVLAELNKIDISSIRSMREWICTQPDAPSYLTEKEDKAKDERVKLK